MTGRLHGKLWGWTVGALVGLSVSIAIYHLIIHNSPLAPTILGQASLVTLSLGFGGVSYYALTAVESPSEKQILGSRTVVAYGLGAIASGSFGYHQYLKPATDLDLDSVIFHAIFVAIVAGMAGVKLGLETVYRERTRLQLENTVDQLTESNIRLEEFTSAISHDLRNPLNVAMGRMEFVREKHNSDNLTAISDALRRMERIIDDIRWLTREDRDIGQTEPVNLQEVSEDAWTITAGELKGVTLNYTEEGNAVWSQIEADKDRLQQLLENLFCNAIDHGGTNISVRVVKLVDGFAIEDDGPGIPTDDREQIFEAGYTTSEDGTGFGLRIVQRVADGHGWELNVRESTSGGARFEITGVDIVDQ